MSVSNNSVKLGSSALPQLDSRIRKPSYDRTQLRPHTVHLGVGGFHRAHQALFLDNLLESRILNDWGECGMGVLAHDTVMRDALRQQDYLYTLIERSATAQTARVIGSIVDFVCNTESTEAAIERLAHPDTHLVSLTVTEGGYFIDEGTGEFDANNADIQHDVRSPEAPKTSLGYIAAALDRRRKRNQSPFTVMSCDNVQGNGHVLRSVLLGLVGMQNKELHQWISTNVAFPNSMVDRITPATSAADREFLQQHFGLVDAWPVVTEPFLQWVIEDQFCAPRPPWEEVGAEIVTDVLPYELMKMRLLNASHMAMAYLGALVGHTYAHETMQDPILLAFIKAFMEEVTPVVPLIRGTSIPQYKKTLIERFANPTINDRVERLCSEGSAKMPKWVLPSIVELAEKRCPTKLLSVLIAAWIRYLQSEVDERGNPIHYVDARAAELKALVHSTGTNPRPFLAEKSIFGNAYFTSPAFVAEVEAALRSLSEIGTEQTMLRYTESAATKAGKIA